MLIENDEEIKVFCEDTYILESIYPIVWKQPDYHLTEISETEKFKGKLRYDLQRNVFFVVSCDFYHKTRGTRSTKPV